MFSKSLQKGLVFAGSLLVAMTLISCKWQPFKNANVGEKRAPKQNVKLNLGQYSCATQIGHKVSDYLDGKMNEAQIRDFMSCIRGALDKFQFYTKGKHADGYLPAELSTFLNREFLKDKKLNDQLVKSIMEVKTVIVGGESTFISKTEMAELKVLISELENEALANLPFLKFYNDSLVAGNVLPDLKELDKARAQLRKTAQYIANRLKVHNKPYKLSSVKTLLTEIRGFLDWDKDRKRSVRTPDQIVKIVTAFKSIVTGKETDVVIGTDWDVLADATVRLYGIFLNFEIYLTRAPKTYGKGLEVLNQTVQEGLSVLQSAIERNPKATLSFSKIDRLVYPLGEIKALPLNLKPASVKETIRNIVPRTFQNLSSTADPKKAEGLTTSMIMEMRAEYYNWYNVQRILSDKAKSQLPGVKIESVIGFKALEQIASDYDFSQDVIKSAFMASGLGSAEVEKMIRDFRPMFRNEDERVWVMPTEDLVKFNVKHNIHNLTRMNVIRSLVRLLIRSVGAKSNIANMSGITESELEQFYQLARLLGEDLTVFDPRKDFSGKRVFKEANLFTFSGNGIQLPSAADSSQHLATFNELMEVLALVWSGGQTRDQLYNFMASRCEKEGHKRGPEDVMGDPTYPRMCFGRFFRTARLTQIDNLPKMKEAIMGFDKAQYAQLISHLQRIAWIPCEDQKYIEKNEIATIATVLHYAEVLFTQYDLNRDNLLDGKEVMKAFPRFNLFLADQIKAKIKGQLGIAFNPQVDQTKAVFKYLIDKRSIPGATALITLMVDSIRFSDDPDSDNRDNSGWVDRNILNPIRDFFEPYPKRPLDRLGLIQVLRVLAENTRPDMRNPKCNF